MSRSPRYRARARRGVLVIGTFLATLAGCGGETPSAERQAPPVTVAAPQRRTVREHAVFTGQARAVESAQVVARVAGRLESVAYEVSTQVGAGDVLFTIEKGRYQAVRDGAFAALQSARADLARAETELERVRRASTSRAVSEMDVDRAVADRDMARAAVLAAEAGLDEAELNLGYCTVRSPIAGFAGRNLVDVGNLVGQGGPTLLTTVNRLQPAYVYFDVPESKVLDFLEQRRREGRDPERAGVDVPAFVALANEEGFPHAGRIDFIDNTVDPRTGTIELRAVMPNEQLHFFPGLFVRVKVPGSEIPDALLVPETALGTDLGGKYVYVVGEGDVVEQRYVQLGQVQGDGTVHVRDGLDGDERVIVNGLMFARPGLPVTPLTAEQFEAMRAARAGGPQG